MTETQGEGPILPIPQVTKHWLLGNLPDIDPAFVAKSLWNLADLYGPIYKLDLGGTETVVISNYELLKDVGEDDHFEKKLTSALVELRDLLGDSLFSARNDEPNWAKAHRILMPVFGPMAVKKMFNQQLDIASQMILKWDRLGPDHEILTSDDFTRLAFDTIGLCAFNYRFNEFYGDNLHPFAQQMADTMIEAGKRGGQSRIQTALHVQAEWKYRSDIEAQHKLCEDIIAERVRDPKPEVNDLLNIMLHNEDPETGEKLDHENIRNQMAVFLIAGHETTSGTLAFLFHNLLRNPETYHKLQQEVDEVLGTDTLTIDHIPKLKYLDGCVKETLRYFGPITLPCRHAKQTCLIGGKHGRYEVRPDQSILMNLKGIHHDRTAFGEDADDFRPERMMNMENIPKGAWRPFGTGMRACIGRAFAEQEIAINVALIMQRFQVEMADPSYKMELLSTMTVKPKNFKIKVRRRPGRSMDVGLGGKSAEEQDVKKPVMNGTGTGKPMLILYGSNAGTCQAYAEQLASDASQHGFQAQTKTLDSIVEHIPTDRPVAIITPSYEGKPADNARKFVTWLETSKNSQVLKGVKYFVFGVGNSEWAQTYHKIPKLVDHLMEQMGAERLIEAAFVDVSSDTIGPFEDWRDKIWQTLGGKGDVSYKSLKASISKGTTAKMLAGFSGDVGKVKQNIMLADNSVGLRKMHMEVELPEDVSYQTGDYLAILPFNHRDDVRRVLNRFGLHSDDAITITETRKEFLKSSAPISVWDLLISRVELGTPITQRQLKGLAETTSDEKEKQAILSMSGDKWEETIKKRFTILDVLDDHPSCKLEFTDYIDMLKPMTARQYSISSSMMDHAVDRNKATATITYDVQETEAWSGKGRTFHGVSSSYLADLKPGNDVRCNVRQTSASFHLPKDATTPIIMIASGTGIAPMRGFIEERAAIQKARGTPLGPALLYYGCRDVDKDYIYKGQLEEWERQGVVSLRPCFSKHGTEKDHFKYTADRIYAEKEECGKLFKDGAKIFICGSASKIAKSTAEVCIKIHMEVFPNATREDADNWLEEIKEHRYVSDVYG